MKSIVKIVQAFPGMPMTEDEVQKFLEDSTAML
jgi:hypothetical protein